ncbi:MAG: hypothetical protein K0S74_1814 [Chlamydiales bacterium]|nr:hypothetical protein [Chlamydiales bacterium]
MFSLVPTLICISIGTYKMAFSPISSSDNNSFYILDPSDEERKVKSKLSSNESQYILIESLPNELLIEIFKNLDLKDHKAINLTSKRISQFSFYKDIRPIIDILEGQIPTKDLTLTYLNFIKIKDWPARLEYAPQFVGYTLNFMYAEPSLMTRQATDLMFRLLKLVEESLPKLSIEKIARLPSKSSIPYQDLCELKAIYRLLEISYELKPQDSNELEHLLNQLQSPHYLQLYTHRNEPAFLSIVNYFITCIDFSKSYDLLLNFLKFLDCLNSVPILQNKIEFVLQHNYSETIKTLLLPILGRFKHNREIILAIVKVWGASLEHLDSNMKNDREVVLAAVAQNGLSLQYALDIFAKDREVVMLALRQNELALQFASDQFKNDKDIILLAIKKNGLALQFASEILKKDREIVLSAVQNNGHALIYVPAELKDDPDIVLAALKQNPYVICSFSEKLMADRNFIMAAVEYAPRILIYASADLRDDKEIALKAVKYDRLSRPLQYVSDRLKDDKEVVLTAIQYDSSSCSIQYASERLKNDDEVSLAAIKQCGRALEYVADKFKGDRKIVEVAIENCCFALQHVSDELKDDFDLVHSAVKQMGYALTYASTRLKANKKIVLTAVSNDHRALQIASAELRNDKEVVLAAVIYDPRAYQYASAEVQQDEDVKRAAGLIWVD